MEISTETCSDRQLIFRAQSTTQIKYQHNEGKHFPPTALLGGADKLCPNFPQVVSAGISSKHLGEVKSSRCVGEEQESSSEAEEIQVCR